MRLGGIAPITWAVPSFPALNRRVSPDVIKEKAVTPNIKKIRTILIIKMIIVFPGKFTIKL